MTYVVEPYYHWKGHFATYANALCRGDAVLITSRLRGTAASDAAFFSFALLRVAQAYDGYRRVCSRLRRGDLVYFLEFEPLSYLLHHRRIARSGAAVIQTIHALKSNHGAGPKRAIVAARNLLFRRALGRMGGIAQRIVVHSAHHLTEAVRLLPAELLTKLAVIEYPAPPVAESSPKRLSPNTVPLLVIPGQIRADKEIDRTLRLLGGAPAKVVAAGRVTDPKVKRESYEANVSVVDRFFDDREYDELIRSATYVFLPYGRGYTGGAGPLKDAMAHGTPVICSPIPLFREFVLREEVGCVCETREEILAFVTGMTAAEYERMSKNCLAYAKRNDWNSLAESYRRIADPARCSESPAP